MELLEKREVYEFAPSFVARENFPEYSLRAYVHKESLKHAYENDPKVAIAHAIDVYDEWDDFSNEGHQYGIALVRGFGAKRIVDFHLYKGLDIDDTPHQWRNSEPSGTHIQIYDRGKVRDIAVTELLGNDIIVSENAVTDSVAMWIPQRSASWKAFSAMSTAILTDDGIGKKIRIWETGEAILTDPKSVYLITDTIS